MITIKGTKIVIFYSNSVWFIAKFAFLHFIIKQAVSIMVIQDQRKLFNYEKYIYNNYPINRLTNPSAGFPQYVLII